MKPKYTDSTLSTQARVDDLMARLSLEEKLGQMVQADGRYEPEPLVSSGRVGSFLHILGERTVELQKLAEQSRLGIPLIFGIDAIHGHGFWPGATVFPTQLGLSCSWNPELVERMARVTAQEMAVTGLHWTFSPVLCLTRDLRWGRVGETFGEDPFLIGELAKAAIRGYQGERLADPSSVAACAKHYAGYSETVGGRDATEADLSQRKLLSYFLPPFEQAAKSGCATFMTAYQCIDGVACVHNHWLMTEVLRDDWGFSGMVVTDWDNVGRAHKFQNLCASVEESVVPSVKAGNDMMMVTPEFHQAALDAVARGELDEAQIDRATRRILTLKFDLGLFDHKRYPALDSAAEVVGCSAHREQLLPAALESVVLLKNEPPKAAGAAALELKPGQRLLPLSSEKLRRVAVVGPNADDALAQLGDWSFGSGQAGLKTGGHPRERVTTILDGIRCRAGTDLEVSYAKGCEVLSDTSQGIAEAVELARAADVAIVVLGDVLEQIGEECDRSHLDLTGGQLPLLEALRETGTPLVAVLVNSKPLEIGWLADHVEAIVEAFNPGMAGGEAIAQILFGDANPCGKLTVSFPRSVAEQPVYYNQIPGWHGRPGPNYDPRPLYAFGFGLSYTHFAYSDMKLGAPTLRGGEAVRASVDVTNTGDREGIEIVQLYLNDRFTSCSTPDKTLKAYARVRLAPGETQRVDFELPFEELSLIDAGCRRVVEPGEFVVMVGGSSRDEDLLRASFLYEPLGS